jgi:NitT/TauT family transport system ATP-binding protein
VKAAELLGFVQTPGQDVLVTPLGKELTNASTVDQKRIVREQLMKLKIFELLVRLIKVQENQCLPSEELLRELTAALPHEKPKPLFRTLLSWGRYAEIISLDQRRHIIRLYESKGPGRAKAAPKPIPPAPAIPAENTTPDTPPPPDLPKS